MRIYSSVDELVGNTPLLRLANIEQNSSLTARIFAKLEYFNPAGSVKDRAALQMIRECEKNGRIDADTVLIEPTSGNTGIGLAAICASRGYRLIIVMPEGMSKERMLLIRAYGAELILTSAEAGMRGAIEKASELEASIPNSFTVGQFDNPSNPKAHYLTTGRELWEDTEGRIDIFISAVGTGGTLSGTARYLKEQASNIKVIAVEPSGSPFISKGISGAHKIQGIGAGFIPKNLDLTLVDDILTVSDNEALEAARECARLEGILVGISSGAALSAAKKLASMEKNSDKSIAMIFPDTGERYLSSGLLE